MKTYLYFNDGDTCLSDKGPRKMDPSIEPRMDMVPRNCTNQPSPHTRSHCNVIKVCNNCCFSQL